MAAFDLNEWSNLGNILVRQGAITDHQLERLLVEQGKRRTALLGELAIELQLCSPDNIKQALAEQETHRMPASTDKLQQAQTVLQRAFVAVSQQADRLDERRKTTGVIRIAISPEEA